MEKCVFNSIQHYFFKTTFGEPKKGTEMKRQMATKFE
jgi:hypothetical protein